MSQMISFRMTLCTKFAVILLSGFLFFISPFSAMAQSLSWSPLIMDFPAVPIGTTETQTLTITNSGTSALTIDAVDWTYNLFESFNFSLDRPLSAAILPPGLSMDIDILFTPVDLSFASANMLIDYYSTNDPTNEGSLNYFVLGDGVEPDSCYPLFDCGGICTDLNTDVNNCGFCSNTCSAPENASVDCDKGVCNFICGEGYEPVGDSCRLDFFSMDIFGMAANNNWRYEGTDEGQPLIVDWNIAAIDQYSFAVPVFVNEIKNNGIFTGNQYFESEGGQMKMWGLSVLIEGGVYDFRFSQGLLTAWAPLYVGEHSYSTALATLDQLPGYTFATDLTVDVVSLETVTLDFATFQAYKINYILTMSGHGISSIDSFSWWVVPYLGVVKRQGEGDELPSKLTAFSIGYGIISENSDADHDGLIDIVELLVIETDWQNADTDGDGIPDGWEVDFDLDPIVNDSLDDPDNDGLNNLEEYQRGSDPYDPEDPCLDTDYLVINPHFSALNSLDTDRVIFFNSSQSTCFEMLSCVKQDRVCTDTWDFGGVGDIIGGNGHDIVVYQYDAGGDYTASLTLTESVSGTPTTGSLLVTAEIVETPLPALNFVSSVDAATVTLSITDPVSSDAAIQSLSVFWGDRYRTEYTESLPATIEHTYTRTGTDYHIRVKAILTNDEEFNYTFMFDKDLTINIP